MPENPIQSLEDRLRAAAQRRRAAAGAPLELPPGKRRLLQHEVARVHGGNGQKSAIRLPWFASWVPRLAWAACLVAFLGIVGMLVTQNPFGLPKPARSEADLDELKFQVPAPPPTAEPTSLASPARTPVPEPAGDRAATPPQATAMPSAIAASDAAMQSSRTETAPTKSAPASETRFRAERPQVVTAGQAMEKRDRLVPAAGTPAAQPTAIPLQTPATRLEPEKLAVPPVDAVLAASPVASAAPAAAVLGQRFALAAPSAKFKRLEAGSPLSRDVRSSQSSRVLENFEMFQDGNQVRLVDADGSVYLGRIRGMEATTGTGTRAGLNRLNESTAASQPDKALSLAPATRRAVGLAEREVSVFAAGTAFEVSGTNRTLRQVVELTGLLVTTNLPGVAGGGGVGRTVLQGRVVVNSSNRFEIHAVRTNP